MKLPLLIIAAGLFPFACDSGLPARHLVYLVDLTGSVPTEIRATSVAAIEEGTRHVRRGDTITVLPITGDAQIQAPPLTLRFHAGAAREPYDADLRRLGREITRGVEDLWRLATEEEPFLQTDLFGTFRLAAEELAHTEPGTVPMLVCLSDFIQDDAAFDFKDDPQLPDPQRAGDFAALVAEREDLALWEVQIYLGSVPSVDLRNLPPARRQAIQRFWTELLERKGGVVVWATDGSGQLPRFLTTPFGRQPGRTDG